MKPHPFTMLVALGAVVGFIFATVSTYDFVIHLDRQLHGIHCSYFPGLGETDTAGTSGCHATLMSPYSSVLRGRFWGGLPVSLPGMSIFAFILFLAVDLMITRRQADLRAIGLLLATATVPVVTSVVMGYLSLVELGVACKSCIGIYAASVLAFAFSLALFIRTLRRRRGATKNRGGEEAKGAEAPPESDEVPRSKPAKAARRSGRHGPLRWGGVVALCAIGGAFVCVPLGLYAAIAPRFDQYVGSCGELSRSADTNRVLVPLGSSSSPVSMIEVIDPLCSACRALETRLTVSGLSTQVSRRALLFPLDAECNWMVDRSIHPGACAVSEGMLCAGDAADDVLAWAFEEQEHIIDASRADPTAAQRMVTERFPELRRCVGSAEVRARLNRALRWAVSNQLPVSAPQLYVEGRKLCDEDTDLGLEYMLPRLIRSARPAARAELPGPRVASSDENVEGVRP